MLALAFEGALRAQDLLGEMLRRVRLGRDMPRSCGRSDRLTAFEAEARIGRQRCCAASAGQAESAATPKAELRVRRVAPPAARALLLRSRVLVCGHSITSSARASSDGGIVRPRAFAVLRMITSSNLVACSTGKSAGLAPVRILFTNPAARRAISVKSSE